MESTLATSESVEEQREHAAVKEEEPSVNSDCRETRIAARRKRVLLKIEADRRAALGEKPSNDDEGEVDPEKNRTSTKQTMKSEQRLEKLVTDGTTLVTNVKVAGDSKEVTRRQDEDDAKKARYERLEAEVTAGLERFEEIMKKWSKGKGKRIPQELQTLLQEQSTSCHSMVDEKDRLIEELQKELKGKDDQYVKNLKKQAEDVDLILERMEEQARMLIKAHQEELKEIEKSFEKERKGLLEIQKKEWEEGMKDRTDKEHFHLQDREERIEKNEASIQHLRVKNAEEFKHIKIKLETDIQSLQQQIQQMKATFQLNAEKLEYNFQVLKKRDEENVVTMSQQKRRITRLQDTLNTLRAKLAKQEKMCKTELQLLIDEYRKSTEQYRELLKKVKHFQITDAKMFRDIWLMNEEKVRKVVKEVLDTDNVIHRQQLGLEWENPPEIESPMNKTVTEKESKRELSGATRYASEVLSEAGSIASSGNQTHKMALAATEKTCSPVPSKTTSKTQYSPVFIKQVLELLCSECEFLIENKLLRLLAPLDMDEQLMMKLDSIFKAIGIDTDDDVHQLVSYFVAQKTEKAEAEEEAQEEGAPSLIHPNDVFNRLHDFVDSRHKSTADSSSTLFKGLVQRGDYDSLLEGGFWDQMIHMLPENHERVWITLLDALEKYHTVLKSRGSLIEDTDSLRQQNTELRLLLHQYMHANINHELHIPPTLVLPVHVEPSMV